MQCQGRRKLNSLLPLVRVAVIKIPGKDLIKATVVNVAFLE